MFASSLLLYTCCDLLIFFVLTYIYTYTYSHTYCPRYHPFSLAKKAFAGYLRSLQLVPGREPVDPTSLPVDEFAWALGLAFTPPVPVVPRGGGAEGREEVRDKKNVNRLVGSWRVQYECYT
jgi:hypothetical protein